MKKINDFTKAKKLAEDYFIQEIEKLGKNKNIATNELIKMINIENFKPHAFFSFFDEQDIIIHIFPTNNRFEVEVNERNLGVLYDKRETAAKEAVIKAFEILEEK